MGCGAQGRVISTFLSRLPQCEKIILADIDAKALNNHATWLKSEKLVVKKLDASNIQEVANVAKNTDILINAVIPRFNLALMKAALVAGVHYIDLAFGPPYSNLEKELELNQSFKKEKVTALTGAGKSPGLTNILVAQALDQLDSIESVRIRVFGELRSSEPVMTWSPLTLIEDSSLPPTVFKDGKLIKVPPFSGEEDYIFPVENIGKRKVWYHEHEEPYMLSKTLGARGLKYCDFKMGGIDQIKALYELGLLNNKTIELGGSRITPQKIVAKLLPKPPSAKELIKKIEQGIITDSTGCSVVEVEGLKNDERLQITLWAIDPSIKDVITYYPVATDDSYVVGVSASLLALLITKMSVEPGVLTPELLPKKLREEFIGLLAMQKPPILIKGKRESWLSFNEKASKKEVRVYV